MSTPAGQHSSQSKTDPVHDEDVTLPPPLSKPASSEAEEQTFVENAGSGVVAPSVSQRPPSRIGEGSMLGPYQILRKLGQGGMGSVYQARHTKLKKMVAIKVLPPEFTRSPALLSRFEREMEAVGKLNHPQIVQAHDAGEFNGTHFLVMEFVEGADLSKFVKEHGPLPVREACLAIRQAALGLQHAHEHGLVHRDIKPSNLFLTNSGQVKLLDLGLARLGDVDESRAGLTSSGQVLGTPDYMAPEQWDDTHSVDARADLYSLGCTLFYLLTGKTPFASDKPRSMMHLMKAHVDGEIPDLVARCPQVPAELNTLYRRLMAKRPEGRLASAAEVATALEPFIPNRPDALGGGASTLDMQVAKRVEGHSDSLPTISDNPKDSSRESLSATLAVSSPNSVPPRNSSRKTLLVAAGAVIALLLTVIVMSQVGRGTRPTDLASQPSVWHGWPADAPPPAIAPFDAEQAKQHQEAWAEYLKVPIEYTNSLGMKFRLIPPGEFMMGSTKEDHHNFVHDLGMPVGSPSRTREGFLKSETPQHRVILTQPFFEAVHEMTQKNYETVMGANPSLYATTGADRSIAEKVASRNTANHPVENLGWKDAFEFCVKLSEREQIKPCYFRGGNTVTFLDGLGYRLPTEAQWEFASRAGTTTRFWCGETDGDLLRAGWFTTNSGDRTHEIGELKPNPFGLCDVHGNVWEWIEDAWEESNYTQFIATEAINPQARDSATLIHAIRGGSVSFTSSLSRSSTRWALPDGGYQTVGFRVVLSVDAVRQALKVTGPAMPEVAGSPLTMPSPDREGVSLIAGGGLSFDGIDDYVEIPTLHPSEGPLTIEAWAETAADSSGMLVSMSHEARQASLWYGNGVGMTQEFSDGRQLAAQSTSVSEFRGKLHHFAGVWDGQNIRFFIDGVPEAASQDNNKQHWSSIPVGTTLGRVTGMVDGNVSSVFLKGRLLSVRISSAVRYQAAFQPTARWKSDEKTLALYDCTQATGATLKDLSGHGHDGKIVGATWGNIASGKRPFAADPAIDFAAERKAAERLLRLEKGTATLGNKDRQVIGVLKEPLPAEPFCIVRVDLNTTGLTDEVLAVLAGCRAIEGLDVSGNPELTVAGLTKLGHLPFLKELDIAQTNVGDELFAWLPNAPMLTALSAAEAPISAAGWESLPRCPQFRNLETSQQVGDAGLRRIVEQCPELRSFTLSDSAISDLSPLTGLLRLHTLHAGPAALTEAGIETLAKLPFLDDLYVDGVDAAGLARLRRLAPKLTRLNLRDQGAGLATSEAWASVTELPGLLELGIDGNIAVDGPTLRRIAAMSELRQLHVGDDSNDKTIFRTFTSDDVAPFRRQRPEVALSIDGQNFPALDDWPGKFEGSTSIAEWTELEPNAPAPAAGTFSADDAKLRQAEWAKHLNQREEFTNSAGMKFRLIPPSEAVVNIGTPDQPRLALQRTARPYYLGSTEVTVGQFKKFVEATGYQTDAERLKNAINAQDQIDPQATWKTPGYAISDDLPVSIVSPADAMAFCAWLNDQPDANATPQISRGASGRLYRLPTEQEWEVACRAGGAGNYGFAGTAERVLDFAWTSENVGGKPTPVQPVATKGQNPFGLFDVFGNVWEWYTSDQGAVLGVLGSAYNHDSNAMSMSSRFLGGHWLRPNVGFRVMRQLQDSRAGRKFREQPVLVARGAPLSPQAVVTRPAPISGVRSWSVELAAHQSYVSSIAWSPLGDVIATTSNDMSIRLWDRDGRLKSILLGHAGELGSDSCASFSPDGAHLATVDLSTDPARPSTLRIWNVSTGVCEAAVTYRNAGRCVAWSPDGKSIAYGPNLRFVVVDVATGQSREVTVESEPHSLAWSPDSKTLCVGLAQGSPALFDAVSGEKLAVLTTPNDKPEEAFPSHVAWSPDGRWIAGAHGKHLHIWDAETRKHLRTVATEFPLIHSLAWHKQSQLLAITGEIGPAICLIFNAASGEVTTQGLALGQGYSIAWSPDGSEVAVHSQGVLHFVDGQTGKLLRSGPERGQNRVDQYQPTFLSPDGKRFHSKNVNVPERLEFDAETGLLLERRKAPRGSWWAVAPDDSWRVYQQTDNQVVLEPRRLDRDPVTITTPGHSYFWRSDPKGERIAMRHDRQVLIWDAATGKPLATLAHPARLWSFEWSPDGSQLATAADDKTIRVWDTKTHQVAAEFQQFPQALNSFSSDFGLGASILAWTRDGRSLWIPLDLQAGLLDLTTGRVAPVESFSNGNSVGSLTLAADGERLLAHEGYAWTFLRDRDGTRQLLGQRLGVRPQWHHDARRFLSGNLDAPFFGTRGYDVATRRRLGTLWSVLTDNHWLCVGPTGHYRGSPGVEDQIVYVAMLEDGSQRTYTPAEFAQQFNWKNDPEKAELLGK